MLAVEEPCRVTASDKHTRARLIDGLVSGQRPGEGNWIYIDMYIMYSHECTHDWVNTWSVFHLNSHWVFFFCP